MRIGIIGLGQMGQAIAQGLIDHAGVAPTEILATGRQVEALRAKAAVLGITPEPDVRALIEAVDCIVLAVKPYQAEALLSPLAEALAGKMLVSVLAGKTHADLRAFLPADSRLLCAVPNTPVAVGQGIWICEATHSLTAADLAFFNTVFGATGTTEYVATDLLGIAGTLAGCGPAFVAMFQEALGDAGVRYGLSREQSYRLIAQLLIGYGSLAATANTHPGVLKDQVCSPGGTTIRGVIALEEHGFRGAVLAAFRAIMERE